MYATEKYNITFFDRISAQFFSETLNTNNVSTFFQELYLHKNAASEQCLMFIDWAIVDLIELAELDDLCEEALNIIVEQDALKTVHLQCRKPRKLS